MRSRRSSEVRAWWSVFVSREVCCPGHVCLLHQTITGPYCWMNIQATMKQATAAVCGHAHNGVSITTDRRSLQPILMLLSATVRPVTMAVASGAFCCFCSPTGSQRRVRRASSNVTAFIASPPWPRQEHTVVVRFNQTGHSSQSANVVTTVYRLSHHMANAFYDQLKHQGFNTDNQTTILSTHTEGDSYQACGTAIRIDGFYVNWITIGFTWTHAVHR